ncbi:hypothetical protein FRX31_020338 [Thalictrum thalictroides]|uniref:Uncharacterized protein n=1 Tax=Thalictrum thalictroides TaxID=46969 RepID=A0A7J6W0E1_THATH|nr:hypothetical protein FRX31_020338 [Thalictrum thalictroides]
MSEADDSEEERVSCSITEEGDRSTSLDEEGIRKNMMENLKASLLQCKTNEDISVWLNWMVSPLAKEMGVCADNENGYVDRLYNELCVGREQTNDFNDDEAPMIDPEARTEGMK